MKRKHLLWIILAIGIVSSVAVFMMRERLNEAWIEWQKADLPETQTFSNIRVDPIHELDKPKETPEEELDEPEPIKIPAQINLDIPFTSQAPHANWDLPYQEACEEASLLMAARYLQGRDISGANDADQAILQLVDHANNVLGFPIDSTAEETKQIGESFYGLNIEVLYEFTWDDIKEALARGYPVIIPAAGRQLGNPNFTAPGPIYHMLVIKGYTETTVITNDPGTRNGADYQYSYDTIYNAIHDWNDGDVPNGKKAILIVKPGSSDE